MSNLRPFKDATGFYAIENWGFPVDFNKSINENLIEAGKIVAKQLKEDVTGCCIDIAPNSTEIEICLGETLGTLSFDIAEAFEGYCVGDRMNKCAIESLDAVITKLSGIRSRVVPFER